MPLGHTPDTAPTTTPARFILFGEDDIDDEEILTEIFSSIDGVYSLLFVNNGRKLIATLDQMEDKHMPCLIVLDYNMPELTGADILKELQKNPRYKKIPKLIWSTSRSNTYRDLCLRLGASEYMIKPSNINDLKTLAKYMLSFC